MHLNHHYTSLKVDVECISSEEVVYVMYRNQRLTAAVTIIVTTLKVFSENVYQLQAFFYVLEIENMGYEVLGKQTKKIHNITRKIFFLFKK